MLKACNYPHILYSLCGPFAAHVKFKLTLPQQLTTNMANPQLVCSQKAQISTLTQGKKKKIFRKVLQDQKEMIRELPITVVSSMPLCSFFIWITRVVTLHPTSPQGSSTDDKDNYKNWSLENPPREVILLPLILYVNVCIHKCLLVCESVRGCSKFISLRSRFKKGLESVMYNWPEVSPLSFWGLCYHD